MEYLAYIGICIIWGLSSIAVKLGVTDIDAITFSFFRFLVSTFVLFAFNIITRKDISIKRENIKIIVISAFCMYFVNSFFIGFALKRLDASIITIFFCLVPLIMVVAQSFLERRLIVGAAGVIGIIGGIIGIIIVSLSSSAGMNVDLIGILFATIGVSGWALGSLYLRNKKVEMSLNSLMMYQSLVPFFIYLCIIVISGGVDFSILRTNTLWSVLYVGVLDSIIATMLFIFLMKRWKVSAVSSYAYVNPVIGLVAAYFILGEEINAKKVLGMSMILVSVFLIQSDSHIKDFFKKKLQKTDG